VGALKIQPGVPSYGRKVRRPETPVQQPVAPKSFSDMLRRQEEQRDREQLREMLENIREQGERLARSMTVRELRLYKQMVKQFLEDTLKRGIGLKETRGWDRRGRQKRYKLLEEVDRLLIEMGEELLETEQGRLELLAKVGEIRGLLLNVAF
jgi:hypothetical protein